MTLKKPVTFGRRGPASTALRRAAPAPLAPAGAWPEPREEPAPAPTCDDLLRNGGREVDEEARMRRFIGPNWPDFEGLWRCMRPDGTLLPSFSAAAFSFSIAWLFYRRLYGLGVAAAAVAIAITRLSPMSSAVGELLLCLAIGVFGKALVIRKGMRTIDAALRERASRGEAAARIERLGGVRLAEALVATILLALFGAADLIRVLQSGVALEGAVPLEGFQELLKAL